MGLFREMGEKKGGRKGGKHPQQLWVSEKNVPWLMAYMATEHALGSVAEIPADPRAGDEDEKEGAAAGAADAAVAASADRITWDWEGNDGYIANTSDEQLRCQISTFTKKVGQG